MLFDRDRLLLDSLGLLILLVRLVNLTLDKLSLAHLSSLLNSLCLACWHNGKEMASRPGDIEPLTADILGSSSKIGFLMAIPTPWPPGIGMAVTEMIPESIGRPTNIGATRTA